MYVKQGSVLRKNNFIRESIREIFTRFHFYQKSDEKDILLLSSMRSGSTWLMEVLSREPKLNYINEPNGVRFVSRSSIKEIIDDPQIYADDVLFSVPDRLKDKIAAYFTVPKLSRLSSPYNVFRKNYHLFVNRRVLKVNDFNPCIDFVLNLGFQNLYLLRHPVPTILSTVRTQIAYQTDAYLNSTAYREKYLNDEQYNAALAIKENGQPHQLRALCWALSHLPLWRYFEQNGKDHNCLLITYEELQMDSNFMINKLAKYLNLKATDALLSGLAVPSASTSDERVSSASFSGQSKIVEWMKPENEAVIKDCFEIIDLFGVEFYNRESPTIIPQYSQLTHQLSEKAI
ncbi:MAG: sulfotransferase domain-containing protein [Bacteroidia bacterium]